MGGMTKPCAASSGIKYKSALIFDTSTHGNVKMPAGVGVGFAGFALEDASAANQVAVQLVGVAKGMSDGSAAINPGDALIIADTTGRLKSKSIANGTTIYQVVGYCVDNAQIAATANLDVSVWIAPCTLAAT
jgi:hypothetical protein